MKAFASVANAAEAGAKWRILIIQTDIITPLGVTSHTRSVKKYTCKSKNAVPVQTKNICFFWGKN